MAARPHYPAHGPGNVVLFPRRFRPHEFADDYRGRMTVYALLFVGATCFVAGGVWLVSAITSIPSHVDCNFSKHRPCNNYPGTLEPVRMIEAPR